MIFLTQPHTSFYLICTCEILKQGINKAFIFFDIIKVPVRLGDTLPRCNYSTTKKNTEKAMLQKSALPMFSVNLNLLS